MKKRLNHIAKHLFVAGALFAFLLQLANVVVNTHFHTTNTGQVVAHAHAQYPFSNSDGKHTHSAVEFTYLQLQTFSDTVFFSQPEIAVLILQPRIVFDTAGQLAFNRLTINAGRAPPASNFI